MKIVNKYALSGHWTWNVLLFFLVWVFMTADRQLITPLQGTLAQEYGLNNSQIGLLNGIFLIAYTLMQLPAGFWGDKFGRVFLLAAGLVTSGVVLGLSGLVSSFALLLVARMLVGGFQGVLFSPLYAISAETIPARHRSTSFAFMNSGQAAGITAGFVFTSFLAFTCEGGWQLPCFIFGALTIGLGLAIWYLIPEPGQSRPVQPMKWSTLKALCRRKTLFRMCLINFLSLYVFFMFLTWLPQCLEEHFGASEGIATGIPSLMVWLSVGSSFVLGWLADRWQNRRQIVTWVMGLSIVALLGLVIAPSLPMAIAALMLYGIVGKVSIDPLLQSLVVDIAPKEDLATSFGFYNFMGMSAASIAPMTTGLLLDLTHSWVASFGVGVLFLVGAWLLVRTLPLPAKAD